MNINATIFVQIVHFLFAYSMLRHFLFKPVVSIIFAHRAYRKRLEDTIEHEEHVYIHKQEQQKEQWNIFKKSWQEIIPSLERHDTKKYPELALQKILLPQDVVAKDSQKIAQDIKERVVNVK